MANVFTSPALALLLPACLRLVKGRGYGGYQKAHKSLNDAISTVPQFLEGDAGLVSENSDRVALIAYGGEGMRWLVLYTLPWFSIYRLTLRGIWGLINTT